MCLFSTAIKTLNFCHNQIFWFTADLYIKCTCKSECTNENFCEIFRHKTTVCQQIFNIQFHTLCACNVPVKSWNDFYTTHVIHVATQLLTVSTHSITFDSTKFEFVFFFFSFFLHFSFAYFTLLACRSSRHWIFANNLNANQNSSA